MRLTLTRKGDPDRKTFGVSREAPMRTQNGFAIARTRKKEGDIAVARYGPMARAAQPWPSCEPTYALSPLRSPMTRRVKRWRRW
jgi:hypothetical protein